MKIATTIKLEFIEISSKESTNGEREKRKRNQPPIVSIELYTRYKATGIAFNGMYIDEMKKRSLIAKW